MTHSFEIASDNLSRGDYEKRADLRDQIHLFFNSPDTFEILTEGIEEFKKRYPNCDNYILYHDLVGGSVPADVTELDMPNHEIETFINDFPNYLIEKKKKAA